MMVYGFPENAADFCELISYEKLRHKLRNMNFEEQLHYLQSIFPEEQVQGWFDAVSPQINDLLTFEEIYEFLQHRNFKNIIRTFNSRNIHVIATKAINS